MKNNVFIGTSFQGYVTATRAELNSILEFFGESADGKCRYDFGGVLGDGICVTAYDWKHGYEIDLYEMFEWNVGGNSREAVTILENALKSIRKVGA
jgi:hypothetical protein